MNPTRTEEDFARNIRQVVATDVAPHWVGGFVDWGRERISQTIPDGGSIEVGADYAAFFARLVRWVVGMPF